MIIELIKPYLTFDWYNEYPTTFHKGTKFKVLVVSKTSFHVKDGYGISIIPKNVAKIISMKLK